MAERIYTAYDNGATLEVIIHKTSKSNMTWYYSAKLWTSNGNAVSSMWLNYFIAHHAGTKLTKEGWVRGNGLGTERSFQVAYDLGHTLGAYGFSKGSNDDGYLINRYEMA